MARTALSDVDVCNMSLDLLRHNDLISSIETPESPTEALASRWYHPTRRSVLSAYKWNFACARTNLHLNSTAPAFGYANAYNLPNDYLGLVFIGENYNDEYELEYAIEGNQILIDNDDSATLQICYLRDVVDVPLFDPIFLDLLVAELAVRIANGITGLNKSMKPLNEWRMICEAKARVKNGRDNPPKKRYKSLIEKKRILVTQLGSSDGVHLFPQL